MFPKVHIPHRANIILPLKKDNLFTKAKAVGSKVSFIQRFHCTAIKKHLQVVSIAF